MLRVGLTGGIASGKSTIAAMFAELGATLIDTDRIAREVVAPGQPVLDEIRRAFGDGVIEANGSLDRAAMRAIVFADRGKREKLETMLHPLIRAKAVEAMERASGPYLIVAVPLLVETGFAALVDRVLVVHADAEQQIARVMERDGIARDQAAAILAAQIDEATRLDAADDVIDNTGSLAAARRQVRRLHDRYLEMTHNEHLRPRPSS